MTLEESPCSRDYVCICVHKVHNNYVYIMCVQKNDKKPQIFNHRAENNGRTLLAIFDVLLHMFNHVVEL